jgi:hypothetical protein
MYKQGKGKGIKKKAPKSVNYLEKLSEKAVCLYDWPQQRDFVPNYRQSMDEWSNTTKSC